MKVKLFGRTFLAATLIGLCVAACAPSLSTYTYSAVGASAPSDVVKGTIDGMRPVVVSGDGLTPGGGMVGTIIGGAAGAIAGSAIGQGTGNLIATLAGGVIGAGIGNVAEHQVTQQPATEYIIRTNYGSYVSVVQAPTPPLYRGQHVLIIYSDRPRVVPDPDYQG